MSATTTDSSVKPEQLLSVHAAMKAGSRKTICLDLHTKTTKSASFGVKKGGTIKLNYDGATQLDKIVSSLEQYGLEVMITPFLLGTISQQELEDLTGYTGLTVDVAWTLMDAGLLDRKALQQKLGVEFPTVETSKLAQALAAHTGGAFTHGLESMSMGTTHKLADKYTFRGIRKSELVSTLIQALQLDFSSEVVKVQVQRMATDLAFSFMHNVRVKTLMEYTRKDVRHNMLLEILGNKAKRVAMINDALLPELAFDTSGRMLAFAHVLLTNLDYSNIKPRRHRFSTIETSMVYQIELMLKAEPAAQRGAIMKRFALALLRKVQLKV